LVELQISGKREELAIKQEDLKIKGHAELRVYAEDPMNDFLQVWVIYVYQLPVGEGFVDNGFEQGMDIPIYYDQC
jgi:propionyl-CoA carboxylase alpha chain